MAKDKIAYVCENCGQESAKWIGKCPACGQWNTFKEIRIANESGTLAARSAATTVRASHTKDRNKEISHCISERYRQKMNQELICTTRS